MRYTAKENYIVDQEGHAVFFNNNRKKLNMLVKRMNNGSGFNGLVPDFFCNSFYG